ncbi:MAG: alcohol dehydrogenase catalytic domain-containing protein [Pseudomonadota bacterium]
MKALVYTGAETLDYREVPDPRQERDDVLVFIDSVGICGSDMHAYLGHDDRRPSPLILGHEGAGRTTDGRRVTINPLVTCGTCRSCASGRDNLCNTRQIISMPPREGAFAEALAMPEKNLVEVPDDLTLEKAALAEPIAVSWHAVRLGLQAVPDDLQDTALVIGGGAIGVAAALSLIAQGINKVTLTDPNPLRRAFIARNADYRVVAPEESYDEIFDIVVDAVGNDTTRAAASAAVHPGGAILHIGLGGGAAGIDIRRMTLQEITVIGTYTYTAQDFRDTCAAMFDGRLGGLDWVETRALADGAAAFSDIRAGQVPAPKVILKP